MKFLNTGTGAVDAGMDILPVKGIIDRSVTFQMVYDECSSKWWCDFFVIGTVNALALSKVKGVWTVLKAASVPPQQVATA